MSEYTPSVIYISYIHSVFMTDAVAATQFTHTRLHCYCFKFTFRTHSGGFSHHKQLYVDFEYGVLNEVSEGLKFRQHRCPEQIERRGPVELWKQLRKVILDR